MTARLSQTARVSCVVPAFNERRTIASVISAVRKVGSIDEVIVIDDGSTDETSRQAKRSGAKVFRHEMNLGKGAAIQTGARKAQNDLILFIDADLKNMTPRKVRSLIDPLIRGKADFVKASYNNTSGRVTKLVAKPLLKVVYPFVHLEQPLSGQFAVDRTKFDWDVIENGWGVDVQLVLQAAKKKLRIKEVFIGDIHHEHQDIDALTFMAEQVISTILSEIKLIAHDAKIVFFDLDKTLITRSSIEVFAKEWNFEEELRMLRERFARGEIPDAVITKTLARHFKGKTQADVNKICAKIPLEPLAEEVIRRLRLRRYRVRIVSAAFSPVVRHFAARLNIYDFLCPRIRIDLHHRYTGILKPSRFEDVSRACCGMYVCKGKAVERVRKKFKCTKEECVAVGDGKGDRCMFDACGVPFGYKHDVTKKRINHLSEILAYLD
ncbi:HAD-IB family phosphatase [Candidatus Peregrinibacteria bacterium]|nr:HAD-IB family phosphatase [Candidatus Peregrinibacteria bacterium]